MRKSERDEKRRLKILEEAERLGVPGFLTPAWQQTYATTPTKFRER